MIKPILVLCLPLLGLCVHHGLNGRLDAWEDHFWQARASLLGLRSSGITEFGSISMSRMSYVFVLGVWYECGAGWRGGNAGAAVGCIQRSETWCKRQTHTCTRTHMMKMECVAWQRDACVYICARARRMTDIYRQCQGDLSAVDKTSSQVNLIPRIRVRLSIICDIRVTCSFGLTGQLDYRRQLNMENSP